MSRSMLRRVDNSRQFDFFSFAPVVLPTDRGPQATSESQPLRVLPPLALSLVDLQPIIPSAEPDTELVTLDQVIMHPREVFSVAIAHRASVIFLAHNHPSGDPSPSEADIRYAWRVDPMQCPVCKKPMRLIAFIENIVDKMLCHLNRWRGPARPPEYTHSTIQRMVRGSSKAFATSDQ